MALRLACFAMLLFAPALAEARESVIGMTEKGGKIHITHAGKPFAVYNTNKDGKLPKPFMSPVRGPDGTVMTRKIFFNRKGGDHPHHKGIWVAVDEVNHVKFWAEKGKIVTRSAKVVERKGGAPTLHVVNEWKNAYGDTEVVESTTIHVSPKRVITYDITFIAEKKPVEFHDTKEGLFGFRMVDSMREKVGGKVINSAGKKGTKNTWGKTANWIDYYGPINGKTYGVTIFDHPKNFRKSRYHVRNYGLFSINPWGNKAYARIETKPTRLETGKKLRLRYAMYIHAGTTKEANVEEVYEAWVKATEK